MARYKEYDYSQSKLIPISFDKQILPDSFEHTLHYLIDNDIDLSVFDVRYKNDETGAPAYDPRVLLKIVLYAYSKGIPSGRKIADCCNVRSSLGLNRFSLRGKKKVSVQWRLYCTVHNLLKVHRYGFGFANS